MSWLAERLNQINGFQEVGRCRPIVFPFRPSNSVLQKVLVKRRIFLTLGIIVDYRNGRCNLWVKGVQIAHNCPGSIEVYFKDPVISK